MKGLGIKADLFFVIYQYLCYKNISRADISQDFLVKLLRTFSGNTPSKRALNYALQSLENDGYIKRKFQTVRDKRGLISQLPTSYSLGVAGHDYIKRWKKVTHNRTANSCTPETSQKVNKSSHFQRPKFSNRSAKSCTQNKDLCINKKKGPLSSREEKIERLREIQNLLRTGTQSRGDLYSLMEEEDSIKKSIQTQPPGKETTQ